MGGFFLSRPIVITDLELTNSTNHKLKMYKLLQYYQSAMQCQRPSCGTRIKHCYKCQAPNGETAVFGSECVKAMTHKHTRAALRLVSDGWRERRSYIYKHLGERVFAIGNGKHGPWLYATPFGAHSITGDWNKRNFLPLPRNVVTELGARIYLFNLIVAAKLKVF